LNFPVSTPSGHYSHSLDVHKSHEGIYFLRVN
jgi:hypothetical protein